MKTPKNSPETDPAKNRTLAGQQVLVTRPESKIAASDTSGFASLESLLAKAGAKTTRHPVIEIAATDDSAAIESAISRLEQFGTAVFLSSAGVEHFLARFTERQLCEYRSLRLAAFGAATKAALVRAGCKVDFVPEHSNSSSMANCLIKDEAPCPVLLLRANRGSSVLGERLSVAGLEFEEVVVYQSVDVSVADPVVQLALEAGGFDWVTITSSAIARSTVALFGDSLQKTRFACISPTAADALRAVGFEPDIVAGDYNFAGLVAAMVKKGSGK